MELGSQAATNTNTNNKENVCGKARREGIREGKKNSFFKTEKASGKKKFSHFVLSFYDSHPHNRY